MQIFNNIDDIKEELKKYRIKFPHNKIGLIPTMGFLHKGHISLIEEARKICDLKIVTIFVNKKQFNDEEDYLKYPSALQEDIKKLQHKADILFIPEMQEIYPPDFSSSITIKKLGEHLCGQKRVGHFDGVALIISKLFNITKPDVAFFGEKDFQQLQIIKQLNYDLNFGVDIIGCDIIREKSGLAMSSRNSRLNDEGKKIAAKIYENLLSARDIFLSKEYNFDQIKILQDITNNLLNAGFDKIDYLEICDEKNLQPVTEFNRNIKSRLFIAIYLQGVRLIDNIRLY